MKFGPTPLADAEGAVLAHTLRLAGGPTLKKGRRLSAEALAALAEAGVAEVIAARLEASDVAEDAAAARVLDALAPAAETAGLRVSAPFAGRANLYAAQTGLFDLDPELGRAVNAVDESVTLATLPPKTWVAPRRMAATVKIIPYAAPDAALRRIEELLAGASRAALPHVAPAQIKTYDLILTRTEGFSEALLEKGAAAVRERMTALGLDAADRWIAPHETSAVADALGAGSAPLALILAASATTDRRDVAPAAIEAAGGVVERLGMPVDPGNLMALGRLGARRVAALPGCARSPKLNGVDWVLERLVAGAPVGSDEIAAMGVGGLLKEISSRPTARMAHSVGERPFVSAILLAAGGSSRMGDGRHKLLEDVDGAPLIRRAAEAALASAADELIVVLGARADATRAALDGLAARMVENALWREGVASSIRAGLSAVAPGADAALILLADMPDVAPRLIDRLIAAFDPEEGREAARPVASDGRGGHPVLFGRRYFEALGALEGDEGARRVIEEAAERRVDLEAGGSAPFTDLDTPEDWARWRSARG